VNPRNYRQFVRGDVIVSLAGIVVNLGLFLLFCLAFALLGLTARAIPGLAGTFAILQEMMEWGMRLNLVLAFFNLIPIPPLDGSHVFYHILPPGLGASYRQVSRYGFLPILALTWFLPGVINVFLWPAQVLLHAGYALVGPFAIGMGVS
jgi:Zn-dependent protease